MKGTDRKTDREKGMSEQEKETGRQIGNYRRRRKTERQRHRGRGK